MISFLTLAQTFLTLFYHPTIDSCSLILSLKFLSLHLRLRKWQFYTHGFSFSQRKKLIFNESWNFKTNQEKHIWIFLFIRVVRFSRSQMLPRQLKCFSFPTQIIGDDELSDWTIETWNEDLAQIFFLSVAFKDTSKQGWLFFSLFAFVLPYS